ncbi:hypothetical protein HK104_010243 [Borealophlyctis nickersoniae]|nr:hypothetical protein HK104_010243 [Borealophlyctis nickersoniae]
MPNWVLSTSLAFLAVTAGSGVDAISKQKLDSFLDKFVTVPNFDTKKVLEQKRLDLNDIYGQNFVIDLTTNDKLLNDIQFKNGNETMDASEFKKENYLKGNIRGVNDDLSFARFNAIDNRTGLQGWFEVPIDSDKNGTPDLYETYFVDMLDPTAPATVSNTLVVYRDQDYKEKLSAPTDNSALRRFLKPGAKTRRRVEKRQAQNLGCQLATIVDNPFVEEFGTNGEKNNAFRSLLRIMNQIEPIYERSFGISLPISVMAFDTPDILGLGQEGTGNTPADITTHLDSFRKAMATNSLGITPDKFCEALYFTFRNYGNTLGIAFTGNPRNTGGVCSGSTATSVLSFRNPSTGQPLPNSDTVTMVAHEVGHAFGAPHDEQTACAAEAKSFIMAAAVSGSTAFSRCSLQSIAANLQVHSDCFTPV